MGKELGRLVAGMLQPFWSKTAFAIFPHSSRAAQDVLVILVADGKYIDDLTSCLFPLQDKSVLKCHGEVPKSGRGVAQLAEDGESTAKADDIGAASSIGRIADQSNAGDLVDCPGDCLCLLGLGSFRDSVKSDLAEYGIALVGDMLGLYDNVHQALDSPDMRRIDGLGLVYLLQQVVIAIRRPIRRHLGSNLTSRSMAYRGLRLYLKDDRS